MKPCGELDRLRAWLVKWGLPTEALEGQHFQRLRFLNEVESRFDEIIEQELDRPLDWRQLRLELGIELPTTHPWWHVAQLAAEGLVSQGFGAAEVERAGQLWGDFILLTGKSLSPLQAAEGWAAGLDYLVRRLTFKGTTHQAHVGRRYGVSASTVSMRFRALVETLGVVIFDHPARKRLHALRVLLVESGQLSEGEFHARVLMGEL